MSGDLQEKILSILAMRKKGFVFSTKSFFPMISENEVSIRESLEDLVESGHIRKIHEDFYDIPYFTQFGVSSPDPFATIRAAESYYGIIIDPSGGSCANIMGLSTQVPAKYIFITNGPSKDIVLRLGKRSTVLQIVSCESEYMKASRLTRIAIHGIGWIGQEHFDHQESRIVVNWLSYHARSVVGTILKESHLAPDWISSILEKACLEAIERCVP